MTLKEEIAQGENVALEFKEARPKDSLKYLKTVVAFANGRGGRILFGVEDGTGQLVGIPREKVAKEMDALTDAIANSCTPPVAVEVRPTVLDGKALIAVDVKGGNKTPYYVRSLGIRKGTFVRVGATSRMAEEYRLKGLILSGENLSFDKQPVGGTRVTSADVVELCRYMTEIARRNCKTDAERRTVKPMSEARLVSMGLLERKQKRLVPTYGYCVISGMDAPHILRPLIKCGAFRGTKKGDFVDRRTCEGRLVDQIDEAYQFVLRNIRVGSEIVGTGRRDVYELPIDSIREAICNAVFHRDYLEPSCVYVAIYDDRLEIVSPGGLVREMTLEDARNGFSKLRNFGIGAALEYMKEVEGWGGGVSRYFESCERMGLPLPIVEEAAGCVKVVFRRRITANGGNLDTNLDTNDTNHDTNDTNVGTNLGERILSLLSEDAKATVDQLARICRVSRPTVNRALKVLKATGRIRREGGTRGRWVVL